jgi:hypothetical protein
VAFDRSSAATSSGGRHTAKCATAFAGSENTVLEQLVVRVVSV